MNKRRAVLVSTLILAITACNSSNEGGSNTAEDFAARINGSKSGAETVEPSDSPTVAAPLPGAVPRSAGVVGVTEETAVPGTMDDPQSSICAANLMGPFIDKPADDAARTAILEAAAGAGSVRFVLPDGANVQPDPASPRLSIMIDNLGIIRDARCG
ncbi:MAG: hypothetical protein ABJ205_07145 [Erythrobacter sp.]|uniref:hypothetical protein n=1 Tax=Erythrobacter sp. TaxID=1042 RepID=UPI003266244A